MNIGNLFTAERIKCNWGISLGDELLYMMVALAEIVVLR